MNLVLRLARVLAAALWRRPRLAPLDASVVHFRVWPNDLDLNFHMNNGRYLSLMDLGRVDLMVRNGIGRLVIRLGWQPVIGAVTIRYRRPLEPFDRYALASRVVSWDEKWFFLEQRFDRDGTTVAVAMVQGLMLRKGGGRVPTAEVMAAAGVSMAPPPLPEAFRLWLEAVGRLGG